MNDFCGTATRCHDNWHNAACAGRQALGEEVLAWIIEIKPDRERATRAFPRFLEWYCAQLSGVTVRDSNGEYVGSTGGQVRDSVANIVSSRIVPQLQDFIRAYEWARTTFADSPAKLGSDGVWRLDPLGRPIA